MGNVIRWLGRGANQASRSATETGVPKDGRPVEASVALAATVDWGRAGGRSCPGMNSTATYRRAAVCPRKSVTTARPAAGRCAVTNREYYAVLRRKPPVKLSPGTES